MKIDTSNVLAVAGIGAALWWLIFGLPGLNDIFTDHPSDKRGTLALAMLFGSFCGLAFYACLAITTIRVCGCSSPRDLAARLQLAHGYFFRSFPFSFLAG